MLLDRAVDPLLNELACDLGLDLGAVDAFDDGERGLPGAEAFDAGGPHHLFILGVEMLLDVAPRDLYLELDEGRVDLVDLRFHRVFSLSPNARRVRGVRASAGLSGQKSPAS